MRRCLWIVLVFLVTGCAGRAPRLPSEGGPVWLELRSAHFLLWSDAPLARSRDILQRLERSRQVIAQALGVEARRVPPIDAIAFRHKRDQQAMGGRKSDGYSWSRGPIPTHRPLVVVSVDENDSFFFEQDLHHLLSHEVAHVISAQRLAHPPAWLSEGISSYFETFRDLPKGTVLGVLRRDFARLLREQGVLPVAELLAGKDAFDPWSFRAAGWTVYAYLRTHHAEALEHYFDRLNARPPEQHQQAWREVFPELEPEHLPRLLARWLSQHHTTQIRVEERATNPVAVRRLGDADVLAMRGLLRRADEQWQAARDDAQASLARDGTHLLAWLLSAEQRHLPTETEARAIVAAHRDDWRAWWLLHGVLPEGAERVAVAEQLCALAGRDHPRCPSPSAPRIPSR